MTSDNPIVLEVLKFEKFLAESRSRRTEAQLRAEISRLKSAGMESAELRSLKRLFEKGKLVSHDDYSRLKSESAELRSLKRLFEKGKLVSHDDYARLKSESAELRSLKRLFEKGKLVSHDDYQLFLDLKRRNRSLLRRAGSKISRALRGT